MCLDTDSRRTAAYIQRAREQESEKGSKSESECEYERERERERARKRARETDAEHASEDRQTGRPNIRERTRNNT